MKNKIKLKWKQRWNDDKSGYWYAAKVPFIGWEYIIDVYDHPETFEIGVFFSKHADDVTFISDKSYRKLQNAMNACEKHLSKSIKSFIALSEQG